MNTLHNYVLIGAPIDAHTTHCVVHITGEKENAGVLAWLFINLTSNGSAQHLTPMDEDQLAHRASALGMIRHQS